MLHIKVIKDQNCKINLNATANLINNLASAIALEIVDNNYKFRERLLTESSPEKYSLELGNRLHGDCIIIVTDIPYDDNWFIHEYKNVIVISLYDWQNISKLPKENGIFYFICCIAFSFVDLSSKTHSTATGCLNDDLSIKNDIDLGMRSAFICDNCQKRIERKRLKKYQIEIKKDLNVLLNYLSDKSRNTKNVLSEQASRPISPAFEKRKSKEKGQIKVFVASASDTLKEREILFQRLGKNFQKVGLEKSTRCRLVVTGWELLAPQIGKPQDIINTKLLNGKVDIVIGILKHKVGTIIRDSNNRIRSISGTAEEIEYALQHPDEVVCMLYVYAQAPSPSLDDKNRRLIEKEWNKMKKYKTKIQGKALYKVYVSEEDLLSLATEHIEQVIGETFISD